MKGSPWLLLLLNQVSQSASQTDPATAIQQHQFEFKAYTETCFRLVLRLSHFPPCLRTRAHTHTTRELTHCCQSPATLNNTFYLLVLVFNTKLSSRAARIYISNNTPNKPTHHAPFTSFHFFTYFFAFTNTRNKSKRN